MMIIKPTYSEVYLCICIAGVNPPHVRVCLKPGPLYACQDLILRHVPCLYLFCRGFPESGLCILCVCVGVGVKKRSLNSDGNH
jgi:hypothetical protein